MNPAGGVQLQLLTTVNPAKVPDGRRRKEGCYKIGVEAPDPPIFVRLVAVKLIAQAKIQG